MNDQTPQPRIIRLGEDFDPADILAGHLAGVERLYGAEAAAIPDGTDPALVQEWSEAMTCSWHPVPFLQWFKGRDFWRYERYRYERLFGPVTLEEWDEIRAEILERVDELQAREAADIEEPEPTKLDEFMAAFLDRLAQEAGLLEGREPRPAPEVSDAEMAEWFPRPKPQPSTSARTTTEVRKGSTIRMVRTTSVEGMVMRRAEWLWDKRLPLGMLSVLAGREGLGKSTMAYWIAAQVTKGTLPGELYGQPRHVAIAATEDSWPSVVLPRLAAAGAEFKRLHRVDVEVITSSGAGRDELVLPSDIGQLGAELSDMNVALLLLDPLISRLSSRLDTHKDSAVRQALEPLVRCIERTGTTALGIMHFNKSGTDDPLNALMGSRGFGGVARLVMTVLPDPDNEDGRVLGVAKSNLGPTGLGRKFTLQERIVETSTGPTPVGAVVWGDEVNESMSEVMRRSSGEHRTAVAEAVEWLTEYLTEHGESESADVKREAKRAGHSDSAVRRARERLAVGTSSTNTVPRRTLWRLPTT